MPEVKKPCHFISKWSMLALVLLFATFYAIPVVAQKTDSIAHTKDSLKTEIPAPKKIKVAKEHSPKKAALMSAIIPGAGQVYNKKYWKVPIIYAGAAGLGYSFVYNQQKYIEYRNAFKVRLYNGPGTVGNHPDYSDSDLLTLQTGYHRYRDLTVIGGALLYFFNIIDASVDAHLFNFSVDDDDFAFNLRPTLIKTAQLNQYTTGVSLSIRF